MNKIKKFLEECSEWDLRENLINFKKSIFYFLDNVYKYFGIYLRNVIIIWWIFNDLIIKIMYFIIISL